jgi:anti-anti-sigma factor
MQPMTNSMQATLRGAPPLVVIELQGDMTVMAKDAIGLDYRQACELGATDILLPFGGVRYINSAGISIVIGVLAETTKSGRRLILTGLSTHYAKIFDTMGLSRFAPVFASEEEARQASAGGEVAPTLPLE